MNFYPQACSSQQGRSRQNRKSARNSNDDYVSCKQECIKDECYKSNGKKVNDYSSCTKDCKDDCDADEARFEAEAAMSVFANGGTESKKCLDECIAAQMA